MVLHSYSPIPNRNTQNDERYFGVLSDSWFQGFSNLEIKMERGGEMVPRNFSCACYFVCYSIYTPVCTYLFLPSSVKPPLSLRGTLNVKRVNKKKKRVETKYQSWFVPLNNYGRCIHTAFRSISIFSYRRQENAQIRSKRM